METTVEAALMAKLSFCFHCQEETAGQLVVEKIPGTKFYNGVLKCAKCHNELNGREIQEVEKPNAPVHE
jgi:hypothetical protein